MSTCIKKNDNDTGDNFSPTRPSCPPVREFSPVSLFSAERIYSIASVFGFHVGAKISNTFKRTITN